MPDSFEIFDCPVCHKHIGKKVTINGVTMLYLKDIDGNDLPTREYRGWCHACKTDLYFSVTSEALKSLVKKTIETFKEA